MVCFSIAVVCAHFLEQPYRTVSNVSPWCARWRKRSSAEITHDLQTPAFSVLYTAVEEIRMTTRSPLIPIVTLVRISVQTRPEAIPIYTYIGHLNVVTMRLSSQKYCSKIDIPSRSQHLQLSSGSRVRRFRHLFSFPAHFGIQCTCKQ